MRQERESTLKIEAANRAEAVALLIRCGYRVYRPEIDIDGEDLLAFTPGGELRAIQMKGRAYVSKSKYGGKNLWLLFPSEKYAGQACRDWYLVPHDRLYDWTKAKHGRAPKWQDEWSYPSLSKELRHFLGKHRLLENTVADFKLRHDPAAA